MEKANGDSITINESNISWQSDREQRYKRAEGDY